MRRRDRSLLAALCATLAGCAADRSAGLKTVQHAELPTIPQVEATLPASIGVERSRTAPAVLFVAQPAPPALTEREKELLAESEPDFDFFEFYSPQPATGLRSGAYRGGVRVGRGVASTTSRAITSAARSFGLTGPHTGTGRVAGGSVARARAQPHARRTVALSGSAGVVPGYGPASGTAAAERRPRYRP